MPNLKLWLPSSFVRLPTACHCFSFWASGQLQLVHAETGSGFERARRRAAVAADEQRRQPGGERRVQVQPGDAGVGSPGSCRSRTAARRRRIRTSQSGNRQAGSTTASCPRRAARLWFLHVRNTAKADEIGAAALPECRRAVAGELAAAVTAEDVGRLVQPVVDASVELIRVEGFGARCLEVVARTVLPARQIRQRNELEEGQRLRRKLVARESRRPENCARAAGFALLAGS